MALANLRVQLAGLMSCTCRAMLATIGRTGEQWHTQPMRQLACELECWYTPCEPGCWHTPYVDIPVPQIVEEIAETRSPLIKCNSNCNVYCEKSKCFRHELVCNRPVDPDLCRQSDALARAQFDTCACLFSVVSLLFDFS